MHRYCLLPKGALVKSILSRQASRRMSATTSESIAPISKPETSEFQVFGATRHRDGHLGSGTDAVCEGGGGGVRGLPCTVHASLVRSRWCPGLASVRPSQVAALADAHPNRVMAKARSNT